jgi:hypothetical protein
MKMSNASAPKTDLADLQFPDWSGMDDSAPRVTADAAFALCEQYPKWFPEATRQYLQRRPEKCEVEFVL